MKSRLIVISDLFGFKENNWIQNYEAILNDYFEVVFYDALVLAEIKKAGKTENELHNVFVDGGIEIAINNLLNLENELVNVLGFSIGGTIGWKAGLKGLKIQRIIGVSCTRLRMEILKPNCKIELFYGENDTYNPPINWFKRMEFSQNILKNSDHNFYYNHENVKLITDFFLIDDLINSYLTSKVVSISELALEKLVNCSNLFNYKYIIDNMANNKSNSELDVSMYILEISGLIKGELPFIISTLKTSFSDIDAINDLELSLLKFN